MEKLIISFNNKSFEEGEWLIAKHVIPLEDILEEEPYVFVLLPAITIYECLRRSPSGSEIELAVGVRYDVNNLHQLGETASVLMKSMLDGAAYLHDLNWDLDKKLRFKRKFSQSMKNDDLELDAEEKTMKSIIIGLSIQITQHHLFKDKFSDVLQLIQQIAKNILD